MRLAKSSSLTEVLDSSRFAISDGQYGVTGEIWRCQDCGFMQVVDIPDALAHYEQLRDPAYERGRAERAIQADRLLRTIQSIRPVGRLLDIGCASGVLVERALKWGYTAQGVEPSRWLHKIAIDRGLPVHLGTFPHPDLPGPYDIVILMDVVEHLHDPLTLLRAVRACVVEDGLVVIATPDVSSLAARVLGSKWWGYRIAHLGYFSHDTLARVMRRAGFRAVRWTHAARYFTGAYLAARLEAYLPRLLRPRAPVFLERCVVPLDLFDFMVGVFAAADAPDVTG